MKTILLILTLLISTTSSGQYKYKHPFRPPPKKGEVIGVIGLVVLATSAIGLLGYSKTAKSVEYIGGSMIVAGVVIDINGKKHKNKKLKRKYYER